MADTISILRRKRSKTLKEEAIDMARDSICAECQGSIFGQMICNDEDSCNGFQTEVKEIMEELKEEKK